MPRQEHIAMDEAGPGVTWPKDRTVETSDGARLAYTFLGPEPGRQAGRGQPVVALCSGLLCADSWWYYLAPALADAGWRVLVWHSRGIASSTLPRTGTKDAFTIPRVAEDLAEIAAAEGLDQLVLIGHSMGVQVALEFYREHPEQVTALVSLTGPYASPIPTLYRRPEINWFVYQPLRPLMHLVPTPMLRLVWWALWGYVPFPPVAQLIGAFGPRTDPAVINSYAAHARSRHPRVVLRIAEGMHGHSAKDLLPYVDVPTLIVVGGRDPFSPPELGRRMAEAIVDSELRTAPLGTHGTIIEYPDLVNDWVLDFMARLPARVAG
jgi:pimeloyl-ACP methyl ester carboxylesterase